MIIVKACFVNSVDIYPTMGINVNRNRDIFTDLKFILKTIEWHITFFYIAKKSYLERKLNVNAVNAWTS